MWNSIYIQDIIERFLPPKAQIVLLETPYKKPAVGTIDLDGDGELELVGVYYWQGENYIIVLKRYCNHWYMEDAMKGKGYDITYFGAAPITSRKKNNLIVGWEVATIWSDLSVYELTNKGLKDSTTYWYYLADAQIKIGDTIEALKSIDRALDSEYPYPSREELLRLKNQILQTRLYPNQLGIDFSSVKSINSETKRDLKLEDAMKKEFDLNQEVGSIRYFYNKIDLNGDGIPEVFVYLVGPFVCGTGGCSGVILKQENGEYKVLSRFSLVNNPVIISNTKTNGYRDIIMYISGGGIKSFFARVKYDGKTYPINPSIEPKVETGTKVCGLAIIADDIAKNPGIDLKINR